jgi:PAS domain S-box-containing protein
MAINDKSKEQLIEELGELRQIIIELEKEKTERKKAEEDLRSKSRIVESSLSAHSTADLDGKINYVNKAFLDIWGYDNHDEVLGKPLPAFFENSEDTIPVLESLNENGIWTGEFKARKKDGTIFISQGLATTIYDNTGKIIGYQSANLDITKRKWAEEGLQKAMNELESKVEERTTELKYTVELLQNEINERKKAEDELGHSKVRLQLSLHASNVGLWDWNLNTNDVYFSPEWKKQIGFEEDEINNRYNEWENRLHPEDLNRTLSKLKEYMEGKRPEYSLEFRLRHKNGSYRWIFARGEILHDTDGNPSSMLGCHIDITERKKIEEQNKASLKEKDALLQEIHHRVKNNMQIISSLMSLQKSNVKDEDSIEMITETQNRIKSMALIHEKLYKSEDLAKINFIKYIEDLSKGLFEFYEVDNSRISLEVDGKDVFFGIDTSIPCGLIINELVTNSLKHVFTDDRKGNIQITLNPINNEEFELAISDNGIGIPEGLDIKKTMSLGLKLRQINGNIKCNRTRGTEFIIKFQQK